MLPKMEVEIKGIAVRFYVTNEDDYDSSFQMMIDGDLGVIHTLNGRAFLRVVKHFHQKIFVYDVKYIRFVMRQPTLERLWLATSEVFDFNILDVIEKRGRELVKVEITLKDPD